MTGSCDNCLDPIAGIPLLQKLLEPAAVLNVTDGVFPEKRVSCLDLLCHESFADIERLIPDECPEIALGGQ
jgi:hypothetical protein